MVASVGSVLLVAFECTVAAATAPVRNGLSGTYFDNAMLLPRDEAALEPCGRVDRLSDLATMNASALPCGGAAVFSARWDGVFAPGFLGKKNHVPRQARDKQKGIWKPKSDCFAQDIWAGWSLGLRDASSSSPAPSGREDSASTPRL